MLYEIERKIDKDYYHSYFYQSKNEYGQIIRCECYQTDYNKKEYNFTFCIKNKRKLNFPQGQITGKDGIKSLVWAYKCLIDCIEFLKCYYPNSTLIVYGDTIRKQKIYQRYLLPLGFKIRQSRYKELFLKL